MADQFIQRPQKVLHALAVRAAYVDHRNIQVPGLQQLLDLQRGQFHGLLVHRIGLRERDDALIDAEQPQDVQVFEGLGHDAVVGGDDEQEGVDAGRSRDHVLDEALVAWHVDQAGPPATRKIQLRVTGHDRDAPAMLLLQPVGVGAGHVADQSGLAVVHVPRRPDGEGDPVPVGVTHGRVSRPRSRLPRRQAVASARPTTAFLRAHGRSRAGQPSVDLRPALRRPFLRA